MAKYDVRYHCGHSATVSLVGPTKERQRKLDWMESQGLCPDCYRESKRAEERAAGPTCILRILPGYDPAAESETLAATAIRRQIEMERCEGSPGTIDYPARLRAEIDELRRRAEAAKKEPAVPRSAELVVIHSYEVRETLKARGYHYSESAISHDLFGAKTSPGWILSVATVESLQAELDWIKTQGWRLQERGTIGRIADAVGTGRLDVLPLQTRDTVEAATAALTRAREQRAEAAARRAEVQRADAEENAKLTTFRVSSTAGKVTQNPGGGWDFSAVAVDGRRANGYILDGFWTIRQIVRNDGMVLDIPSSCAEADRIGADAQKVLAWHAAQEVAS